MFESCRVYHQYQIRKGRRNDGPFAFPERFILRLPQQIVVAFGRIT